MKDNDQTLIFENYKTKRLRSERIAYLCEDFGDQEGKNPFATNDDDSDDKPEESSSDSKPEKKSKPSTSKTSTKPKDGKLSEEELDEELEILATKKAKIQKLFDSDDIDKDVAGEALAKLKDLTNALVSQYI